MDSCTGAASCGCASRGDAGSTGLCNSDSTADTHTCPGLLHAASTNNTGYSGLNADQGSLALRVLYMLIRAPYHSGLNVAQGSQTGPLQSQDHEDHENIIQ